MDRTRMILGVLLVVSLPPAVLFWLVIHPFAGVWRKLGLPTTYTITAVLSVLIGLLFFRARTTIMGPDLGTNWGLFLVGCLLYLVSARISVLTRRQLDNRTFIGVPEISWEESKGVLLQEGIYGVVRHPRYLAVMIGIAGYTLVVNYFGLYLLYLGSMSALPVVVILEERELAHRFGGEYSEYRSRVPALIPRIDSRLKDLLYSGKPPSA